MVAIVAILCALSVNSPTPVSADNSKDASFVGVCIAVYKGEVFRAELADLDTHLTTSERKSLETMMIDRWLLPEIAGKYNHEYYDYPNPVKSVTRADLDRVACKWAAGNKPPSDP